MTSQSDEVVAGRRQFPRLEGWLTATEVAAALGMSRQTVNKRILAGAFTTTHQLGDRPVYVVASSEVASMLEDRKHSPEPTAR